MNFDYKKYKLFFFDLDGTLLNDDKSISDENIKMIYKLQEEGKYVCIITGRSAFNNSLRYAKKLVHPNPKFRRFQNFLVVLNGAEIIDLTSGASIYNNFIDQVHATRLLNYMHKIGWLTIIYTENETIVNKRNPIARSIVNREIAQRVICQSDVNCKKPVKKITAHVLLKFDERVDALQERFNDHIEIIRHGTRKFYQVVEINAKNVSKYTAGKKVAAYHDVHMHECVAFGDSFNDLPLLNRVGLSVSFANALTAVQEKVQFVSKSSDENGVAHALKLIRGR